MYQGFSFSVEMPAGCLMSVCYFVTDEAKNGDKTLLVVGVVVGLVIAAVVIGLAYWLYMKNSK